MFFANRLVHYELGLMSVMYKPVATSKARIQSTQR